LPPAVVDYSGQRGVIVVEANPRVTSMTCLKCGGKMKEAGHENEAAVCGVEAGRDVPAVLNIERKAKSLLGSPSFPLSPQR